MSETDPLDRQPLWCLVGPTASGKTALALDLCEESGAEVLSLDSMLVYRGLDIGTAKPSREEQARVPHHLMDLVCPSEPYDVQRYLGAAREALSDIQGRGARGLFVGGTGFYLAVLLRGLFEGPPADHDLRLKLEGEREAVGAEAFHQRLAQVDPEAAQRLHPNDMRRVVRAMEVLEQTGRTLTSWQDDWNAGPGPRQKKARLVGLSVERDVLEERIRARAAIMLDQGWREEAVAVREGPGFGPSAGAALGYEEVLAWDAGELTREEALERIAVRTRQFARRQRTWYQKFDITWIPADTPDLLDRARTVLGI
ncbi:MAG: tRNA (adenosine(37)-N6)-dimethylallyltransferase MiaA [Planctomycetota bacterium]|nr:tRNA (adenosine(37)-N6)-dimethylallyltransferase MiaA [Planctomycetota bacterium]